ncbi:hypothetical protein ACJX0J_037717, partial [Zea mays]
SHFQSLCYDLGHTTFGGVESIKPGQQPILNQKLSMEGYSGRQMKSMCHTMMILIINFIAIVESWKQGTVKAFARSTMFSTFAGWGHGQVSKVLTKMRAARELFSNCLSHVG